MARIFQTSLAVLLLVGPLASCTSAARLTDEALRTGSFGRIQATPFMDVIHEQNCRETLLRTVGFTKQTLAVTEGVQVSQVYHCRAERIVAKVNLKNLTGAEMQCVARTEDSETGARIGPYGVANFEYSFARGASHSCFNIG